MSLREKYGNVLIDDIVHYDDVERDHFTQVVFDTYKGNIYKINGKRVIGKGLFKRYTDEEKSRLGWIKLAIKMDEEGGITSIYGYGHRNAIFPLELWVRRLFDERRVVSYNATDTCTRSFEFDGPDSSVLSFYQENKRRLEMLKKGIQLELPDYRQEKEKVLVKEEV